jgi:hypothetical protein
MKPIKLDTLKIDSGRPLVEVDTTDGHTIFLTSKDIESLQDYFKYALPILKREEKQLGWKDSEA